MFELFQRPTVFAHRGASHDAPENTLAAFELAVHLGAEAIELDAQLSADKQVVVIHDHTVDRTTDGRGRVSDLQLATLKQLDAGGYFDSTFRGERIPTLREVFETLGQRILINIELKNDASIWDDLPAHVAQLVIQYKLQQRVIFSSFNPIALLKIHRILPDTPCSLLALSGAKGAWACSWGYKALGCAGLHPDVSSVTASLVRRVHQSGRRIHAYTVNEPEVIHQLLDLGVDGFFTDDSALALSQVKTWLENTRSSSGARNMNKA
jgi:glycerophosphoryl diester phosphodiesterase